MNSTLPLKEVSAICADLFIKQADVENKFRLTYFDGLIAASALAIDGIIHFG